MYEGLIIGLLIVLAGIASIEIGISTAMLEVVVGVIAANLLGISGYNVPWLGFLSNFGLLGLMFFAGFEIDREMLRRHLKKSLVIGSSSYFIPLTLLFLVALPFFSLDPRPSALVAIALSTTSLALVYSLLRGRGLLKKEAGQVLLTSSMFIDMLSMLSLSVVFVPFEYDLLIYIAILAVFMYLTPKLGRYILSRYRGNLVEIETRFLLVLLLSLAFFADRLHVSVAVLAFVVGFVLSELLREHEPLVEKLKGVVFGFMAPLFFFNAGSLMDMGTMESHSLIFLLILGLSAYFSKYAGAFFSTYKRYGPRFSKLSGLIFNYRLSFGTIAAIFGLESGMISDSIYTALITIVLSTSIASCVLLKVKVREV